MKLFKRMMSSSSSKCCKLIYVYRKCKICVPIKQITDLLQVTQLRNQNKDLFDYCYNMRCNATNSKENTVDSIIMLAHPIDTDTGELDTAKRIAIICLGIQYTIYKKRNANDMSENPKGVMWHKMKISARDQYDIISERYKEYDFTPLTFYSEQEANRYVEAQDAKDLFNNRHDVLFEFNYKTKTTYECHKCGSLVDTYCAKCDYRYVCTKCHPHTSGVYYVQSKCLILNKIRNIELNSYQRRLGEFNFIFCDKNQIDLELITAVPPEYLPWAKDIEEEFVSQEKNKRDQVEVVKDEEISIKVYH